MNPNIDEAEVLKFNKAANDWWDEKGQFKTLHRINPIRTKYIDEQAFLNNKKAVDVGCGGGLLTESMAQKGAVVTGIDISPQLINIAKLHQYESQLTIRYEVTTAENLATKESEQFDVVTCLEMLEHVPDPFSVIHACAKLVKQQGHVFFSTLNRTLKAYCFAILGGEYILKLLPKNTHDYAKFIRPSELAAEAKKANLTLVDSKGLHYNIFNHTVTLTNNLDVNYLMHFIKA